ncbi:unnamed protein product [Rotaria sp. Silwood2]|nr:unnamed protein product [Rotaria sp. Silwood2]CAF2796431.1 unnamed protein product [Rotaria sp. Silwood2]CAF3063329.1 unnamed protein product [Rotaria sp. Silwood2]CAF3254407.1 unnamed protein product [Rotaria sp. Silwood2]CAF4273486.1 unnamed protein product [Rotaria sp. Silwood2]
MNIHDLPDEILLRILNKLNNIDILYSLVNVNQRFDRLALDSIYIRDLDFTVNDISEECHQFFDRFSTSILPRIHHQIKKLTLEQFSIERLLYIVDYPQLYSLSLVFSQPETIFKYLIGDTILIRLLTKQITHFNLKINSRTIESFDRYEPTLFAMILSFAKCLTDFTFLQSIRDPLINSIFNLFSTNCVSSTLTKLKIDVNTLDDCLYILDGRSDCLSTLIIDIETIGPQLWNIDTTKKISKLKYFSLTSTSRTSYYHELVPLFRRMTNLEELTLFLFVKRIKSTYIDGIHLNDEILIHMPRLNKFTFSITTLVCNRNSNIILPSNDDIQRSFIERKYQQIGSYADDNTMKIRARCHIYSLPYQFDMFHNVTNSFKGAIFDKVRSVIIIDDIRPFEYEFSRIISQSFPFLQTLSIQNNEPQKYKKYLFKFITFPHLNVLNLELAHIDYIEQFLFERKTHLPCLLHLTIQYDSLVMITNNFTNNPTYFNFAKLKTLLTDKAFVRPENFHLYFPRL